jgi:hypothetical protein
MASDSHRGKKDKRKISFHTTAGHFFKSAWGNGKRECHSGYPQAEYEQFPRILAV